MKRSLIALLLCATVLVSTALPVFAVETSINAEHAISSITLEKTNGFYMADPQKEKKDETKEAIRQ